MILELKEVSTFYGQSHILHDVSLTVGQGEVVCLLGRNGAGKTTTLRGIMGLAPPRSGSIRFQGMEISQKKPFQVARLGIGYVPDDRRIFPDLTVCENLELARRVSGRGRAGWTLERIYELFPVLGAARRRKGLQLSGGEQKMLAIGRALAKNPTLLLLDEPAEGLAPLVLQDLVGVLGAIRREGMTILLADQNIKFCRRVADRGYILEKGIIQHHGTMQEIWDNEEVIRKYLVV